MTEVVARRRGDAGAAVRPGGLAEWISRLKDDDAVDRLGRMARARLEATYHRRAALERLEEMYRSLL
jgi:glycosyltransferase involved in cell wall biosynthesis